MQGVHYAIDHLGRALADAEMRVTQLEQENAVLRQRLDASEAQQHAAPSNCTEIGP